MIMNELREKDGGAQSSCNPYRPVLRSQEGCSGFISLSSYVHFADSLMSTAGTIRSDLGQILVDHKYCIVHRMINVNHLGRGPHIWILQGSISDLMVKSWYPDGTEYIAVAFENLGWEQRVHSWAVGTQGDSSGVLWE